MKKAHTILRSLTTAKIPAIPAVLAMVLTLGLVVGVGAVNDKKQIVAYEDYTIAIKLDGEVQLPVNANGSRVYPITYNGTTYLPIRAVAGMAGLEVDWDQANQTVLLASKPADGVDLIETLKPYYLSDDARHYQTSDKKTQEISGKTYSHWDSIGISWTDHKGDQRNISYNIDGKYETLTFQYYSKTDAILRVLGDNDHVLAQVSIKGGQVAQTATVDLLSTSQLTFQVEKTHESTNPWDGFDVFIFDARLK